MKCCSSTERVEEKTKQNKKKFAVFENLGVSFVHVPLAQNHIHVPLFIAQTNVC